MKRELTKEVKTRLKKAAKELGVDITKLIPWKTGKSNVMCRIYHAYTSGSTNALNRQLPGGIPVLDVLAHAELEDAFKENEAHNL